MWSDNGIIRPSPKIIVNTKRTYSPWNNSWGTFSRTPDTWYSGWICWTFCFPFNVVCQAVSGDNAVIYYNFPHKGKEQIKSYPEIRKKNLYSWMRYMCILIKLVLHLVFCSVFYIRNPDRMLKFGFGVFVL